MLRRHHLVHFSWLSLPCILLLFTLILSLPNLAAAQPAIVPYIDCFSGNDSLKLQVSDVYAQLLQGGPQGAHLNFTLIGQTPQQIINAPVDANGTVAATTLFTTTDFLTFQQWNNNSYFCMHLRPPSPLPNSTNGEYCPLNAGPFALSTRIELPSSYELVTYNTRLRALDPLQNELLCLDLKTTALKPGAVGSIYGHVHIAFWATVALAIGYWLVVGIARIVSAWGRGPNRGGPGVWARIESAGFILASALSGERLANSPALMRYCTPSLRDIIFHTQWCAALAMVAVEWPTFVYPILSQTAWSTLSYNISITQGANASHDHWDPLSVPPFQPPSDFADQLSDPNSILFIDTTAPNVLFQLPTDARPGMESFAYTVGLRPQDLFGICLSLFLAIIAAAIVVTVLIWSLDWFFSLLGGAVSGGNQSASILAGSRSPRYSSASKDMLDGAGSLPTADENRSLNGHFLLRSASRFPNRPWWKLQSNFVGFHGNILHGNLVRVLILFHLPVTIFSCYQMTLGRNHATLASIILAALSFAFLSILFPVFLIFRLTMTNTTKLYDETWTLLSLGPLYNHYRHGSQLFACLLFASNLAFGVTIGCGQKSGTAQAIIILVVEVASSLGTSVWLPWGHGASMGLISFLFCVARIVIAVLLVILTPIVSIDVGAAQWVAYAILFILGLIYLTFFLMLVMKLVEAVLRISWGIGFHRSRHVVDTGLLGVLSMVGCCGSRKPAPSSRRRSHTSPEIPKPPSTLLLPRPVAFKDMTPSPSSSPPSVLRPEHALQPYKEESDDETGYIMGAWQPFPGPGYTPVEEPQPVPEKPKSGFARVGGGRAHYESPYAIASGSTQTFPHVDRGKRPDSTLLQQNTPLDYSPPPTPSVSSAAKRADLSLPPGARPPAHIRTKSQTAIIEDASALLNAAFPPSAADNAVPADQTAENQEDDLSPMAQPKRKHWYTRRKSRRMSDSDLVPETNEEQTPGRSFVVVRKQRPGVPQRQAGGSADLTSQLTRRSESNV